MPALSSTPQPTLPAARTEPMMQELLERGLTVAGSRTWLLKQLKPVVNQTG
jgi:hypothetical protein